MVKHTPTSRQQQPKNLLCLTILWGWHVTGSELMNVARSSFFKSALQLLQEALS